MTCNEIHQIFNNPDRHKFPFNEEAIPDNGIYILFEQGEKGHDTDRIVRVGTHTGEDQLCSRLMEHFINENKDRSIFRKNIGRAMLNQDDDPFLRQWNRDLTSWAARQKYAGKINFKKQADIEKKVTNYIQRKFSFVVFEVDQKKLRLESESKIISTVSWCEECGPSKKWLGLHSPKSRICQSGLWLVNNLYREPLEKKDVKKIERMLI